MRHGVRAPKKHGLIRRSRQKHCKPLDTPIKSGYDIIFSIKFGFATVEDVPRSAHPKKAWFGPVVVIFGLDPEIQGRYTAKPLDTPIKSGYDTLFLGL